MAQPRPTPAASQRPPGKYPLNDAVRGAAYRGLSVEETFTRIYETSAWGKGSGAGSLPAHCLVWIQFVRKFIRDEKVRSVVDLGCGDWQFSPYIYHDLGVEYVGYDTVLPVIRENREQWGDQGYVFEHLDFSTSVAEIRDAELYILKDVLQHWSSARVARVLRELLPSKPHLRFVLICNCAEPADWPEDDIEDGGWRPLTAARQPLAEFSPEVLLRFPSLPNLKEVSVIRVKPAEAPRGPRPSPECRPPPRAEGARRRGGFFIAEGCHRQRHPRRRGGSQPSDAS